MKACKQNMWAPSKSIKWKWGPHFAQPAHSLRPLLHIRHILASFGYLIPNQKAFIYTSHIKKVIAKGRGGARGVPGGATAAQKFCLAPPKFSAWRHATALKLFKAIRHRPLTAPLVHVANLAPPVAPPNQNVWLRPWPKVILLLSSEAKQLTNNAWSEISQRSEISLVTGNKQGWITPNEGPAAGRAGGPCFQLQNMNFRGQAGSGLLKKWWL